MKTFQQFSAELVISEEDYDRMKDRRMERGGVDGNTRYPLKSSGGGDKKVSDDEVRARQKKALDMVRASVIAKHGAGALLSNKKNESYVPGKPAEKLGAVTAIPKDERQAALERIKAKTAEMRKKKGLPEEFEIEEGMTLKDFKANRRKLKRKEASSDAKKRGHVGKEWYNSGRTYSPDEAKRSRAKIDDEERRTRHRSAVDPDNEDDNNYSADKTKNPKKLRKQKAMGELG